MVIFFRITLLFLLGTLSACEDALPLKMKGKQGDAATFQAIWETAADADIGERVDLPSLSKTPPTATLIERYTAATGESCRRFLPSNHSPYIIACYNRTTSSWESLTAHAAPETIQADVTLAPTQAAPIVDSSPVSEGQTSDLSLPSADLVIQEAK